jgi:hypothetical protein
MCSLLSTSQRLKNTALSFKIDEELNSRCNFANAEERREHTNPMLYTQSESTEIPTSVKSRTYACTGYLAFIVL